MAAKKPTATIKSAVFSTRSGQLLGHIFDDSQERFKDGSAISTSSVKRFFVEDNTMFVETLNTVYKVEGDIAHL